MKEKRISFKIRGSGNEQPVVFVHGWGGNIKSLENLAILASEKYKTTVLDLPGFGQSDCPHPSWGVKEYAEAVISLMKKLKLSNIVYFGHSFGGSLGIYIAGNYPGLIKKLILCDSSFKREVKISPMARFFRKLPTKLKLLIYKFFFPNSDLSKFPHLETNFRKIIVEDLTGYLSRINVPTLILWGEGDRQTPVDWAHELKNRIKNSKLKIFPNAGHNLPIIKPEIVYQQLIEFI